MGYEGESAGKEGTNGEEGEHPEANRARLEVGARVARWPELGELRLAAGARGRARLAAAMGQLTSTVRVAFGRGLLEHLGQAGGGGPGGLGLAGRRAAGLFSECRDLLRGGLPGLRMAWRWTDREEGELRRQLEGLVGGGKGRQAGEGVLASGPPQGVEGQGERLGCERCLFFMGLASGWGWSDALRDLGDLGAGSFSDDGRCFYRGGRGGAARGARVPSTEQGCWGVGVAEAGDCYRIWVGEYGVEAVAGDYDMRPAGQDFGGASMVIPKDPGRRPFPSRWLPEYVRLPLGADGRPKLPAHGVATVVEVADRWRKLVGPLDGTTEAIISGQYVVPRTGWPTRRSWRPNHKSWEGDPEAKAALGPKLAEYFYRGVLEWVSPRAPCLPATVSPLAAVDKATDPFYRLVQDAREPNVGVAPWKVKYYTVRDLAILVDYGDILFATDFEDAYHLTVLPGCHAGQREERWVEQGPDGGWVWKTQRRIGCTGGTCSFFCDKSMAAVRLEGQLVRVAAAHFGQTTAGAPLSYLVNTVRRHFAARKGGLGPAPREWLSRGALQSVVWVDDTVWNVKGTLHGFCGGLEAGCVECGLLLLEGQLALKEVEELCDTLHLWLSEGKKQEPGQRVEYTGIIVDTIRGRFFCPEGKRAKLVAALKEMGGASAMSARGVAGVRGKVLHYSICIPYIKVFAVWFSHVIGSEEEQGWDRRVHLPSNTSEVCASIIEIVETRHQQGMPLWPYVPSSLFRAMSGGEMGGGRGRLHIVHDASHEGWGAFIEWAGRRELVVSTFTECELTNAQVRRETLAGHLAFKAASQLTDISGMVVLHRSDCVGALAALRKGSYASRPLQDIAVRFTQRCARLRTENYFLHVSGETLVAEGVDDASRGVARQVAFPACTQRMRDLLRDEAALHGWKLTVDLFASEVNAVVPRFYSRFAEPGSEAVDALSVPDWDGSECPECGKGHREVIFAYPPPDLVKVFIRKAMADGVRGLVLVATAVTAPFWGRLLEAALPRPEVGGEPFRRLRRLDRLLEGPADLHVGELALFAVDFGRGHRGGSDREGGGGVACAGFLRRRERAELGSAADRADRAEIRAAVAAHVAARDGRRRGGDEAPDVSIEGAAPGQLAWWDRLVQVNHADPRQGRLPPGAGHGGGGGPWDLAGGLLRGNGVGDQRRELAGGDDGHRGRGGRVGCEVGGGLQKTRRTLDGGGVDAGKGVGELADGAHLGGGEACSGGAAANVGGGVPGGDVRPALGPGVAGRGEGGVGCHIISTPAPSEGLADSVGRGVRAAGEVHRPVRRDAAPDEVPGASGHGGRDAAV